MYASESVSLTALFGKVVSVAIATDDELEEVAVFVAEEKWDGMTVRRKSRPLKARRIMRYFFIMALLSKERADCWRNGKQLTDVPFSCIMKDNQILKAAPYKTKTDPHPGGVLSGKSVETGMPGAGGIRSEDSERCPAKK